MDRDLACGLIGTAIALAYLNAAADIPTSALGDTVGAAGVPHLLGYALAAVSVAFVAQRAIALARGKAAEARTGGVFDDPVPAFASAAGTVLICAAFVFLLEPVGYLPAVAFLIFALCVYQRVAINARLALIATGGAFALWLLFAVLLSVRMPAGIWAEMI